MPPIEFSIGTLAELHNACIKAIQDCFAELLNDLHLYQHVDINVEEIRAKSNSPLIHPRAAALPIEVGDWFIFGSLGLPNKLVDNQQLISLPVIRAYCDGCKGRFPANLSSDPRLAPTMSRLSQAHQLFSIPLVCQGCRNQVVTFVVARLHRRLILVGRYPIERIEVPPYFPKNIRDHYSDARLAFNSGQVLPALFMLRTLIEQFMRSKVGTEFVRGEDLSKAYKETLPADFKATFPTLADSYESLSDALHSAKADPKLFVEQHEKIDRHFDARRLYKLDQLDEQKKKPKKG